MRRLLVLLLTSTLFFAACGDSDSTTEAGDGDSTEQNGDGGVDGDSAAGLFSSSDECIQFAAEVSQAMGSAFAGATDPESLEAGIAQADEFFAAAVEQAPSEIRGDMAILAEAFTELAQALADADYDFTKLDPATMESVSSDEVEAASQRVSDWFESNCGELPE